MALFRYQFVTGDVQDVEVSDELYDMLMSLDHQERKGERRETRRHVLMSRASELGMQFADKSCDMTDALLDQEQFAYLVRDLVPQQQSLLRRHLLDGETIIAIARAEGVTEGAIRHRIHKAITALRKKLL